MPQSSGLDIPLGQPKTNNKGQSNSYSPGKPKTNNKGQQCSISGNSCSISGNEDEEGSKIVGLFQEVRATHVRASIYWRLAFQLAARGAAIFHKPTNGIVIASRKNRHHSNSKQNKNRHHSNSKQKLHRGKRTLNS